MVLYDSFLPASPSKQPVLPVTLRTKATALADNLRLRAHAALVAWRDASDDPSTIGTMELRSRKVPRSPRSCSPSRSPSRSPAAPPIESRCKVGFATGVGILLMAYAILPSAKSLSAAADHCHMRVPSLSASEDIVALEAAATWHQAVASAAEAQLVSAEAAVTWHQAAAEAAESQLTSTKAEAARLEVLLQYTSTRLGEERQQTQRRQRDEAEQCEATVAAKGEEWAAAVAASETALAQGEARWAEEAAQWAGERSELLTAAEAATEELTVRGAESLARCEAAAQVGSFAQPNPTTSPPRRALRALRAHAPKPPSPPP